MFFHYTNGDIMCDQKNYSFHKFARVAIMRHEVKSTKGFRGSSLACPYLFWRIELLRRPEGMYSMSVDESQ